MRFSRGFQGKSEFSFKPSNINILRLDFRQNPLKVEKPLKMAVFGTASRLLNDPEFSRTNRRVRFLFL